MTTENLFGSETTTTAQPATKTEESQSLLTALVGEKQKYKSAEELAKAYANADQFIQTLKEENEKLRQEVQKARTMDEVLEQLKTTPQKQADEPVVAQTLSTAQVAEIVKQQLTGMENERTRQANLVKADKAMKEKFGEKALEVFQSAATSEAHKKVLTELAAVDPDKFVALFTQTGVQTTPVVTGSVNTAAFSTTPTSKSEWSREWVNEVRTKDPNRYWSAEFQYTLQNNVVKKPSLYFKE